MHLSIPEHINTRIKTELQNLKSTSDFDDVTMHEFHDLCAKPKSAS